MTEESVRVQKPIGENNHYLQLFSGYLQIEKPNTDFVLKFAYQKLIKLLHLLPDILFSAVDAETAEEDESSYEKEVILGQETLTITARTKKNDETILSISKKVPNTPTAIVEKNIEKTKLSLMSIHEIALFFETLIISLVLLLNGSDIQQAGIFSFIKKMATIDRECLLYLKWPQMSLNHEEKKTIMEEIFEDKEAQASLDLFIIYNHRVLLTCIRSSIILEPFIEDK